MASSRPTMARLRTSRRDACCRRDTGSMVVASAWPMRPTAVAVAMACTSETPTPRVTTVLANSWPRASPGNLASGTDSPVSSDSSTSRWPSRNTASAAMRSPSCSTSTSPHTTSRPGMRISCPARITSARGADNSRSDSSARCVLRSCTRVMPMITNTDASRKIASARSPSIRYRLPATSSIRNIGSMSTLTAIARIGLGVLPGSRLGPCAASRRAASAGSSPVRLAGWGGFTVPMRSPGVRCRRPRKVAGEGSPGRGPVWRIDRRYRVRQRQTSTGTSASSSVFCVTLPSNSFSMPRQPCVAITITSQWYFETAAAIAHSGRLSIS